MKLLARAIYAIVGVSVRKGLPPSPNLIDNSAITHRAASAFIKTKPVDLTCPEHLRQARRSRLDDITKSC